MAETTSSAFEPSPAFEHWRAGYGPITHNDETVERIRALALSPNASVPAAIAPMIGQGLGSTRW